MVLIHVISQLKQGRAQRREDASVWKWPKNTARVGENSDRASVWRPHGWNGTFSSSMPASSSTPAHKLSAQSHKVQQLHEPNKEQSGDTGERSLTPNHMLTSSMKQKHHYIKKHKKNCWHHPLNRAFLTSSHNQFIVQRISFFERTKSLAKEINLKLSGAELLIPPCGLKEYL